MAVAPAETLFDDILEFLAGSPTTEQIVNYQPSITLQQRLNDLLDKIRTVRLTESEQHELDEFMGMNRFMSRPKLKARKRLS